MITILNIARDFTIFNTELFMREPSEDDELLIGFNSIAYPFNV